LTERFSAVPTSLKAKRTLLYFYLTSRSGEARHSPFEYRFLEVLCKNWEVIVAFSTRSGRARPDEKIAPDAAKLMPLLDLPLLGRLPLPVRSPVETFIGVLRVLILVQALRPDIVIGNWVTRLSGLHCALAGCHPFLAVVWGSDVLVEARSSRVLRTFARFTLRVADAIIVDSEVQRRAVLNLGCNASKVYCFPWGIDLDEFKPERATPVREELGWLDNKIVVCTRKHYPMYGIEYIIRAIPLILESVRDAKFLFVGNGPPLDYQRPLLEYHKSLTERLGVQSHVKFMGFVPNHFLPRILNAADVYVSTSFSDGSSASLMEAIACGLPVVVTRIPANEEWIVDGENGFLVPTADSVSLAQCIARILLDDELRSRMRDANLDLASKRANWKINSLVLEKAVSDLLCQ
jgi:glycosyltransferase involved in cell wall biosynthesis